MMKTLIESPPRTMMEVYKSLPEGTLVELIDNNIYMSPSPLPRHQVVLNEINFQLMLHFRSNPVGMVYVSPFDIYLDETSNAVQPDLSVILNENPNPVDPERHFHGVPDLVIEILSAGNQEYDQVKKKELYERFGVKEYWMVDPETKLATGFTLQQGRYHARPEGSGRIATRLLNTEFLF